MRGYVHVVVLRTVLLGLSLIERQLRNWISPLGLRKNLDQVRKASRRLRYRPEERTLRSMIEDRLEEATQKASQRKRRRR